MRKFLLTLICLLIAVPAFAGETSFTLYPVKYPVLVEGAKLNSNLPILTYKANGGDNTYVPLRAVLDIMGATTEWDGTKANVKVGPDPKVVANSVVQIYAYKNGKLVSRGSGVIYGYDEILTASHLAEAGDSFKVIYNDGNETTAKLKKNIPGIDTALLTPARTSVKPVKIGDSDELLAAEVAQKSTKIYIISSPKGERNVILNGWFLRFAYANGKNVFMTTAITDPGSSGGGIFSTDGELLGIVSGGDGSWSYSVPINDIRKSLTD